MGEAQRRRRHDASAEPFPEGGEDEAGEGEEAEEDISFIHSPPYMTRSRLIVSASGVRIRRRTR